MRRRQGQRQAKQDALDRERLVSRLEWQRALLKEAAEELHENIGQLLILTQLTTFSIEEKVGDPALAPDFKTVYESLQTGINSVRTLSNKLKAENQPAGGSHLEPGFRA
ncbi:hypothetical protein ACFPMF_08700 [Larkinella bovis]|uniref:Signal transduction histidine kinase subgroup 3 dimerisation and phosphoacceptor domain-containing protein n=1 Tax=Larkinella bovis TaxID=683041 RepID=A0ABW0IAD8_9BACT